MRENTDTIYAVILIGTVYQPNAKLSAILSIITSTFTRTIILTGDTNIDIKEDFNIQKQYTELLNNFNLVQHMQLPTRKGKKSIEHTITNIPNEVSY